jgi:hypothetical protein
MKAILSGERRTLVCLIFWLAGSFTAGPSSDVSGERDLAAGVALVAPNPVWPRSSALDARLEKETGVDEADQLGDERRLRSMSFFEAIAGNDEDTFCKMLNEGMDPNVELPTPVPIAFQKRFTDGRLRYYLSKDEGFTALMLATVLGNDRFVNILLSAGADPWKETKKHKTFALWLAAKYKNIEIMQSLMGIGPNHESRVFRITINLSKQKAFLWRNGKIELVTPISSGMRSPLREDDTSLPTNTGIGNRHYIRPRCLSFCGCPAAILAFIWAGCLAIRPPMAAFAFPRDLREGFMPQCQ